ncbi:hypothetical protein EBU95_21275 [bacterium]|nr:hypothetical protein [bacterium]
MFVASYSGYIYQITLNNAGIPTSQTSLLNSNSLTQKTSITFDTVSNTKLYLIDNSLGSGFYSYDLISTSYTYFTARGTSLSGIYSILFYGTRLYLVSVTDYTILYKGAINSGTNSITYSSYLTGFISTRFIYGASSDTMYVTDYVTGGNTSVLYKISSVSSGPSKSVVPVIPSTNINSFDPLSISSDSTTAYVENYGSDGTGTMTVVIVPLTIPCICEGSMILTVNGYQKVEELQEGDLIKTPCNRAVPIVRIFKDTMLGNEENSPYYIPADLFYPNVPDRDIFISGHHAIFGREQWILPCQYDEKMIKQCKDYYGKEFVYYHIQLPDYENDKLMCSNLAIDSWDGNKRTLI